jgi:hypothetical protein
MRGGEIYPLVLFPRDSRADGTVPKGYLYKVDGVLWVAKTFEDAQRRIPSIDKPLDVSRLKPSHGIKGAFEYLAKILP